MQKKAAATQMHKELPADCQTHFSNRGKNTELLDW